MVEISELDFTYPRHGFRLCVEQLRVNAGEQLALIGPSGSGKSTLLNLMAGIVVPAKGTVCVDGSDLGSLSSSARGELRLTTIGLVFQSFELLDYLTVWENVLLPFRLNRALKLTPQVFELAEHLLEELELSGKRGRYPNQLSQGERQRVAIGRALVTEPGLVLADEPTGNLDPLSKTRVLDLLLASAAKHEVAVVVVTHDHALLDRFETAYEVGLSKTGEPWTEISKVAGK
ncbi:MAG: ATP-binding cassette domain-containing protein [Planctomycetota bacterium]